MRWHRGSWYTLLVSFSGPLTALDYPEAKQKLFERGFCIWLGNSMEGLKFSFLADIIHAYYSRSTFTFFQRRNKVSYHSWDWICCENNCGRVFGFTSQSVEIIMIDLAVTGTRVLELPDSFIYTNFLCLLKHSYV